MNEMVLKNAENQQGSIFLFNNLGGYYIDCKLARLTKF